MRRFIQVVPFLALVGLIGTAQVCGLGRKIRQP
jgi:hypothetical protein